MVNIIGSIKIIYLLQRDIYFKETLLHIETNYPNKTLIPIHKNLPHKEGD